MTNEIKLTEQQTQFKLAAIAGAMRDLAIYYGGTGHLRPEISDAEFTRRRNKRKAAKAARKANR